MQLSCLNIGLLGAFLLGLLHVFQPCEDKAVVAIFIMWGAKKFRQCLFLVLLYGLSMTAINTILGFIISLAGAALIHEYETLLKLFAGIATLGFGIYMLKGLHFHSEKDKSFSEASALSILTLGIMRGIAICPAEATVLSWALSSGDIIQGTLMLVFFGIGTTLSLIPAAMLVGSATLSLRKTKYGHFLPKIAPLMMVAFGIFILISPFLGIEIHHHH